MTSKKNIFVFGATGMVGTAFEQKVSNTQHSLFKINRDFFDVEKDQLTRELISGADYVVNFAGIINSKIQNTHEKSVYCCNTLFPVKLADICDASNIPLIHMSTDCVFSGKKGCYKETDVPDATDLYGQSKIAGECADSAMVIRTSVIGPEQKDFKSLLCWFLKQDKSCDGYTNHLWNGLTNFQLSKAIVTIIDEDLFNRGVQHLYSNDVSKYELLNIIKSKFDKDIVINPIDVENAKDMRLRSVRPAFVENHNIPSLESQIEALLKYSNKTGKWNVHA